MQIENNKIQMRKGVLELSILLVLMKNEAYPSDIIDALKKSGLEVPEGTVYPILTRLKNEGYLTYRWEESPKGAPRKYYTSTESGIEFAQFLWNSWSELGKSLEKLKTLSQSK